jgi:predicted transcriptional regulator
MGPDARDYRMAPFLTDFDREEGETDGLYEGDVRLDQVLADPGHRLFYAYDFGDSWSHTVKLEKVEPWVQDAPTGRHAQYTRPVVSSRYHLGMAMTLRLSAEQDAKLAELARAQGVSKQQAVLRLIDAATERTVRRREIDTIMDDVLTRDAELLDRLAQ